MNWIELATLLADQHEDPIFAIDPTGTLRMLNRAGEQLFGVVRADVVGGPWQQLTDRAGRARVAAAVGAALRGTRRSAEVGVPGRGTREVTLHPIGQPSRRSHGLLGVVHASRADLARRARAREDRGLLGRLVREQVAALAERRALSERERQVLDHMILGDPVEAIGEALGISPRTAKFHQANVLAKLGISSRLELIRLLIEPLA